MLFIMTCHFVNAQLSPTDSVPKDPGALSVYTVQNMNFGAFAPGSAGGTVTLSPDGLRSTAGTIVPLNLGFNYFQAIFEIEGPPGFIISMLNGPDAVLTGSNGGSMSLRLGASNPMAPFVNSIAPPGRTLVNFGGVLTVGNQTTVVPGTYSGTFYVTFNQE